MSKRHFFSLTFQCHCSVAALSAQAQADHTLSGIVRDADGVALQGAHLQVVGTKFRALTDADGRFHLRLGKMGGKVTLLVSHLGMQTQRITLNGEQTRDIVLKPDNRSLDEVVVTGYQKVRNRIYTGAASAVKMQDIRLEGVADVSKMLEGRVAGLNLQTISGTFWRSPSHQHPRWCVHLGQCSAFVGHRWRCL